MGKLKISRNLATGKYLMVITGLASIIGLVYFRNDANTSIPFAIFLVVSGLLYYVFSKAKTVEFDEQSLFISSKTKSEVVPLSSIIRIKLTMTQVNYNHFWKIKYRDNDGLIKAVRILPKPDSFEVFKKALQDKNPKITIKNWSHILDFDQ